MIKKQFLKTVTVFLPFLLLTGCGNQAETEEENTEQEELTTLTIGVMPATDNIPLIVAQDQGFDKEHGVELVLEDFSSARDRDAAFQAEELDGVSTDLVAIAIYQQAGQDVNITGSTFGQFDLITGDDSVQTVADLEGKEIIYAQNTATQYASERMLEAAGVSSDSVTVVEVPQVPTRLELLKNQQASAAILPEPFVTMAKSDGLRVLESTNNMGINPFVMGFPSDVIEEKQEAIRGMYEAYNDAVAYMQEHDSDDYIDLFIEEIGFPETLKDQIVVPDYTEAQQVKESDVVSAFEWAQANGLLTEALEPSEVISDVYFK